jgi:nitroreductase
MISSAWADVKLSKPRTSGGDEIFSLLERRASGTRGNFPNGDVALDDLSTILWAATGLNRGGKGWTVPLAGGRPPYVKIYAVKNDGVFRYDWKEHSLAEISAKNEIGNISNDDFVRKSPCVLVFVSDTTNLGSMGRFNADNSLSYNAAGAMGQNVYLAADALGISTRYMISMNTSAVKEELKLEESDTPLCIMPLGKR